MPTTREALEDGSLRLWHLIPFDTWETEQVTGEPHKSLYL